MKMLVKFEDTDLLEARCRAHIPPEDFGIQFISGADVIPGRIFQ